MLSVFVAVSVLLWSTAWADVYDDFSSKDINTTKWTIRSTPGGTPGLFTPSKEGRTGTHLRKLNSLGVTSESHRARL